MKRLYKQSEEYMYGETLNDILNEYGLYQYPVGDTDSWCSVDDDSTILEIDYKDELDHLDDLYNESKDFKGAVREYVEDTLKSHDIEIEY